MSIRGVAGQKLFVVDDEQQIAELLSRYLREAAFDVETFYDASSALLRARDCPPDILVSDVVMPGIDGVILAKKLKDLNPDCKIILISGNPDWQIHGDAQIGSVEDFVLLPKPFALTQLLRLIKSE